jgi:hypothetical protein
MKRLGVIQMCDGHEYAEVTADTLSTLPIRVHVALSSEQDATDSVATLVFGFAAVSVLRVSDRHLIQPEERLGESDRTASPSCFFSGSLNYLALEEILAMVVTNSILNPSIQVSSESYSFEIMLEPELSRYAGGLPEACLLRTLVMSTLHDIRRIGVKLSNTVITRPPQNDPKRSPAKNLFSQVGGGL